jgi:hypothetical protein
VRDNARQHLAEIYKYLFLKDYLSIPAGASDHKKPCCGWPA